VYTETCPHCGVVSRRLWKWRGEQGLVEYAMSSSGVLWYRFLKDPDLPQYWKIVAY
jgi:hypothetical protein